MPFLCVLTELFGFFLNKTEIHQSRVTTDLWWHLLDSTKTLDSPVKVYSVTYMLAQSDGAVEYTNCISAEEWNTQPKECPA